MSAVAHETSRVEVSDEMKEHLQKHTNRNGAATRMKWPGAVGRGLALSDVRDTPRKVISRCSMISQKTGRPFASN